VVERDHIEHVVEDAAALARPLEHPLASARGGALERRTDGEPVDPCRRPVHERRLDENFRDFDDGLAGHDYSTTASDGAVKTPFDRARCSVAAPTPNSAAICLSVRPSARSSRAFSTSTRRRGRPILAPLRRALSSPAFRPLDDPRPLLLGDPTENGDE
jgi:hypothetical protein